MSKLISVNDEIESISLYTLRPLFLHGYVLPFLLLYGGWLYIWVAVLGFSDYVEAGCIGFVIIGLLQVVCSLLCLWFVNVRCLLTCSRVRHAFWLLLIFLKLNISKCKLSITRGIAQNIAYGLNTIGGMCNLERVKKMKDLVYYCSYCPRPSSVMFFTILDWLIVLFIFITCKDKWHFYVTLNLGSVRRTDLN